MRKTVLSLILVFLASPVLAGELTVLGGYGRTNNPIEKTFAWQLQYMEGLGEHLAYSLSYLNQGHFTEHHRDAHAANLWLRTNLFDRHLSLGVGGGGLFYYDTSHPTAGPAAQDVHGWGTMASVAATWYTKSRLLFQVQGYWVRGGKASTPYRRSPASATNSIPRLQRDRRKRNPTIQRTTDNELTVLGRRNHREYLRPGTFVAAMHSNTGAESGASWS